MYANVCFVVDYADSTSSNYRGHGKSPRGKSYVPKYGGPPMTPDFVLGYGNGFYPAPLSPFSPPPIPEPASTLFIPEGAGNLALKEVMKLQM